MSSFTLPVAMVEDSPNPATASTNENAKITKEAALQFDATMEALPVPQDPICQGHQPANRAFAFAIGSIFNDDSKRAFAIKTQVFTKGVRSPDEEPEVSLGKVRSVLHQTST